jgi:hypothetical protein
MMGIAIRETVIVEEYLELALAQCRAVEMRKIINRRPGRVHGRLVNQMDLAEKGWITRYSVGQPRQALEERHAQRAVFLKYDGQRVRQVLNRGEYQLRLPRLLASRVVILFHDNFPRL